MHKEEGETKFEKSTGGMELITNFCAMHMRANLRKSFISGIHKLPGSDKDSTEREHKLIISFMNLPSYLGNIVYQSIAWESYSLGIISSYN